MKPRQVVETVVEDNGRISVILTHYAWKANFISSQKRKYKISNGGKTNS